MLDAKPPNNNARDLPMSLPDIDGLELQDLIGKGSCGAVYRAVVGETREACAVKVFSSMAINRKLLTIGMRGLQQMPEHPGILKVHHFDFDKAPYHVAVPLVGFMTEDAQRRKHWETPTLEGCCGTVPPDEAWRYIYEVCDSMAWLHKHNLVHCNLKPRNVLLEDDQASATKIGDPVQGWIGGVHHFDTTDHFLYIPPEQAEHPDALATHGTSWDVYAFGVLAYRLLTGKFPRAEEELEREIREQANFNGTVRTVDNGAILAAVRAQHDIEWPKKPTSKWDERRKQILEKCLALDPKLRWPDLREVMREFEKLEADYLLEDAREKIGIEKRRQARRVMLLRTMVQVLFVALVAAAGYGLWYGYDKYTKWQHAEKATAVIAKEKEEGEKAREGKITDLATKLQQAKEAERLASSNLQMSQAAVDQFLTQLLQLPAGLGLQAEISQKHVNDALAFCEQERPRLEKDESQLPLRATNYFNTAQLLMRKNQQKEAKAWFEKARSTLNLLLQREPTHADVTRRQIMLGRTCRWLGTMKAEEGHRVEASQYFKEAVAALTPALEKNPKDRNARVECAMAWYELGKRSRRDGETAVAVNALGRVPTLMDAKVVGEELTPQEQFLLARSRIEQALSLRDEGRLDEAMRALFDSMEVMVKLVEKSAPHNQEQALTLAEAYIEFGEIVSGKLGTTDAKDAQAEAQAILMELVRTQPQWAEARYLLARNYGALAALERDQGNATEARTKQESAVKTLEDLSKDNPDNTRFLTEYARQKGAHAQMLCDLNKAKDAVPIAKEGVDRLEELMQKNDASLDELDRKACGVLLAQLYGILGQSGEAAKDSKLAKSSFAKASEHWEALKSRHGHDETIDAGLNWSKERLGKFK
ncbi:serine/threonine protein kinase [Roseimicrobium gellanilyticum]|uniref:Serine/threonine protein kinase n=2 Tax=Roseimicrobium gellanilyticum TaxID=748857 RepID=A0A366HFF3_9BACT|nr:serine/threonine protein kinase [Roseimicrobium gellanilyticum]